jgi:hypothetical protein
MYKNEEGHVVQWTKFSESKPEEGQHILFREERERCEMYPDGWAKGTGHYYAEDASDWNGEWMEWPR